MISCSLNWFSSFFVIAIGVAVTPAASLGSPRTMKGQIHIFQCPFLLLAIFLLHPLIFSKSAGSIELGRFFDVVVIVIFLFSARVTQERDIFGHWILFLAMWIHGRTVTCHCFVKWTEVWVALTLLVTVNPWHWWLFVPDNWQTHRKRFCHCRWKWFGLQCQLICKRRLEKDSQQVLCAMAWGCKARHLVQWCLITTGHGGCCWLMIVIPELKWDPQSDLWLKGKPGCDQVCQSGSGLDLRLAQFCNHNCFVLDC